MAKLKQIRRAQTLSPFGVGGILDIEGESFVAADIYRWKNQGEVIREPRLEAALDVSRFRMAPAARNPWSGSASAGIPYFRFPQWVFCPQCRRMSRLSITKETGEPPVCLACHGKPRLIPMRFVMACPRGHLADVAWERWAHSRHQGKCEQPVLEFQTQPGGSGLEFLSVRCRICKAERTLEAIASPDSLKPLGIRCTGRQPWQTQQEARSCNAVPQVLQRGATNLTFASIASAIDIPPHSSWSTYSSVSLQITNTEEFRLLLSSPSGPIADMLIPLIAGKLGIDDETVKRCLHAELDSQRQDANVGHASKGDLDNLLAQEYEAFLAPDTRDSDPRDRFIKRFVPVAEYNSASAGSQYGEAVALLDQCVSHVVQITRLREVRALKGFSRLAPVEGGNAAGEATGPGRFSVYESEARISPSLVPANLGPADHNSRWLPAIEVYGEGIFLTLDEALLQRWEALPGVTARVQVLVDRHLASGSQQDPPTPRLMLLHTLAHLLIRQLSFECGYSIASLRERIYAAEPDERPMAGILIYTAAGDSEGTLGGLVREGMAQRLFPTIIKALQSAEWCSSDPLCRESHGQGFGAMNLAACHACALLPETSCTMANRLLDRTLLLGSQDAPDTGFFSAVMAHVLDAMGSEHLGG